MLRITAAGVFGDYLKHIRSSRGQQTPYFDSRKSNVFFSSMRLQILTDREITAVYLVHITTNHLDTVNCLRLKKIQKEHLHCLRDPRA